ncbi:acetyl-CoA synthetase-like protein [Polychaeton citri CBS 116435]|uniref:Acetyl-CoA synthetase-like protein n=1 Tax=Polychaeton citri CBS 116435 TaxID=1314669 RepID=A0A9P4UJQ3_9PEZI|nr:acetyl-CoA synthetase-like protein [Polychaeton citri CBS 116435]
MRFENQYTAGQWSASSTGPKHLLDLLKKAASTDSGLVYLDNGINEPATKFSYSQLFEQAKENGALLREAGIVQKGQIAITYFDTHIENVLWFWSVIAAGGIGAVLNPLSNEPKTAAGQLENIKTLFGETPLITSAKLAPILAEQKLNVRSTQQIKRAGLKAEAPSVDDVLALSSPSDIAAILFTSGSTGHSKAVQYSHAQLIASVEAKADHLGSRGKTFMSWISFDHSANFCEVHLQSMFVGTDQVHVPTAELVVEPHRFFQVLSTYKIGYTFSPNFFLASAARSFNEQQNASANLDLSNLSTIMCGGEANRTETLEACDQVLRSFGAPKHAIKAAYGLSETCSACFYNLESPQYDLNNGNVFASAGKHLPGALEMKLVQEDQEEPGQGIVYLRGDVIFKGYYNNPDATSSCMTEDGWFNTGDIAKVDEAGNIHLLGRAKEILILNGNNYSSFELEYSLETSQIPGLTTSYTAVFSSWDEKQHSEAVVVLFNPTEEAIGPNNLKKTLQAVDRCVFNFCSQKAFHIIPLPKSLLPKSTIGKLSRAKLKKQYEAGAFNDFLVDDILAPARKTAIATDTKTEMSLDSLSPLEREVAVVYSSIVNVPAEDLVGPDALLSSGINSLGFMKLKKALEKALHMDREIPMPLLVQCHSVEELASGLTKLGTTSTEYDPIVPLWTKGSKRAIFLIHPGAGEFLCWMNLLEYLPDRPIYAIRSKGLHTGEETFANLDEMLQSYYSAIRRVQPEGPYVMLGYCWGGLLAFELTKMLEADGQTVAFCGGVDNPPDIRRALGHMRWRSVLVDVLPGITGMSEEEAIEFTKETSELEDDEFYKAIYARFPPEFIKENEDITVQRIQAYGRVEDCHRTIAAKYEPKGRVSKIDIFCADAMPHFNVEPLGSWDAVLQQWKNYSDDPGLHRVSGTHYSVLKKPQIEDFQDMLNKALVARGV